MRHPLEAIIEMIDSLVGMLLKHIKEIIIFKYTNETKDFAALNKFHDQK